MMEQVFVARERELDQLQGHLDRALAGQGQICFVTGEAGTGKTALVTEFIRRAQAVHSDLLVTMGTCNAQAGIGDPYLPFREVLRQLTGDVSLERVQQLAPENAGRLRTALVRSVQVLVEVAPELVGVLVPGAMILGALGKAVANKAGWMDRLEELTEQRARTTEVGVPLAEQSRIFEQYTAFIQGLSAEVPLILFLDDLQWGDTASIGLLFHLARRIESSRVLILGAYRPADVALGLGGERHPLEPVVHELTRYHGDICVELDVISEAARRQFLDALLDAEPNRLGSPFREALFRRTGGHALFTVELVREMQERGDLIRDSGGRWVVGPDLDWEALPARVEGVIAERIDRLDRELRDILTVASVEGKRFSAEVVARVQAMAPLNTIRLLSDQLQRQHRLVSARGLIQHGHVRLSLYRFVHDLFQQYLYGKLSEAERIYLHSAVGGVLEALFAEQTEEVAGQLAHHFELAGVPDKAASYRLQAGNSARRLSAHHEAVAHLTRGLELLESVRPGAERMRLELGLQTALGTAFVATHGYASPQVEQAFARASELALASEDPSDDIPVLYGLCAYHFVRSELRKAYAEGKPLLSLTQQVGETGYEMGCRLVLGAAAMHLGEFDRARKHLGFVVDRYDLSQHRHLAYHMGHDPAVGALSYLSLTLWHLGYPDQAIAKKDAALDLARELDHPYTLGYAASFAAMLLQMLRLWSECQRQADIALQLGRERHYPSWEAIGSLTGGSAMVHQGHVEEGIARLERGITIWAGTGAKLAVPYQRALLAEACLAAGRREEGLEAVEESFARPKEAWWLPEQHRVRAELLLLAPGAEVQAEATLRNALDLARSQKAKSLALRAAVRLASLLRMQGRPAEGREVLSERYAWFTEGLNTPDLREARGLLEDLEMAIGVPVVSYD